MRFGLRIGDFTAFFNMAPQMRGLVTSTVSRNLIISGVSIHAYAALAPTPTRVAGLRASHHPQPNSLLLSVSLPRTGIPDAYPLPSAPGVLHTA